MNRGDVVEVDWPFTDRTGSKVRSAVVVQADFLNGVIDDTILVQITGTAHGLPGTEALLDPAIKTASGLSKVCYANCLNLLTLEQADVQRVIGVLSDVAMLQIQTCLKVTLEMS